MGVQCEVFIASRDRAKKYSFRGECECKSVRTCECWEEFASETYDYIENHRIYTDDFAQLLSVLRGKKNSKVMREEFKAVKKFSEEGPWIEKVPDDLPKLLSTKTKKELTSINKTWVELMSKRYPIPTKDRVIFFDYLILLQSLCQKSIEKKQGMYLWTCL